MIKFSKIRGHFHYPVCGRISGVSQHSSGHKTFVLFSWAARAAAGRRSGRSGTASRMEEHGPGPGEDLSLNIPQVPYSVLHDLES
jgi:hypothetical protein